MLMLEDAATAIFRAGVIVGAMILGGETFGTAGAILGFAAGSLFVVSAADYL